MLQPLKDSHDLTFLGGRWGEISITLLLCRKLYRLNFLPFSPSKELKWKSVGLFIIDFLWMGLSQVLPAEKN